MPQIYLRQELCKQVNSPVCKRLPCQCGTCLVLRWLARGGYSQRSGAHISLRVIAILLVRAKKLVSVEDALSAPIRGGDKYPRILMVSGLMDKIY